MANLDGTCCDICSSIIDTFNSCIDYVLGTDRSNYEYKKNDDAIRTNDPPNEVRIDLTDNITNQEVVIENYIS